MMRSVFLALIVLPSLALAVQAQDGPVDDVTYDDALLMSCLTSNQESDLSVCIGSASGACMEASEVGGTTMGMSLCLANEVDQWDGLLNAVYQKLMAAEKAADAEMVEIGVDGPKMAEALKAMQRAWIAYRDASCDYEVSQWGNGTGAGPAYQSCMMDMTARQALDLISRLESKDI